MPGQRLNTILIRLTDAKGNGVPGWRVEWSGDGTVVPVDTVTDVLGFVSAVWTLPRVADSFLPFPTGPSGIYSMSGVVAGVGTASLTTEARAFTADRIDAAHGYACGARGAELWCWGARWPREPRAVRRITLPPGVALGTFVVGETIRCLLDASGDPWCDGDIVGTNWRQIEHAPPLLDLSVTGVDWRGGIVCGRAALDRTSWCWDQDPNRPRVAQQVSAMAFTTLDGGDQFTCGLAMDQTAWCWGANDRGQLGDGTTEHSTTPVTVSGGHRFEGLSVGGEGGCGSTASREVFCWGAGAARESAAQPQLVPGEWVRGPNIFVGKAGELYVRQAGKVRVWYLGSEIYLTAFFAGFDVLELAGSGAACVRTLTNEIACSFDMLTDVIVEGQLPAALMPVPDPRSYVPGYS